MRNHFAHGWGWLQLIRVPNLTTVPGDTLAGACLAGIAIGGHRPALAAVIGAGICLYAGGLALNDWADTEEDCRSRPFRPIPSGRISRRTAFLTAMLLLTAGIGLTFFSGWMSWMTACILAGVIVLYNLVLKPLKLWASLAMGLCRGLNVLLGATAAGMAVEWGHVVGFAVGVFLYIAVVTWIASDETIRKRIGLKRWMPAMIMGVTFILLDFKLIVEFRPHFIPALILQVVTTTWLWHCGHDLQGTPVPDIVGRTIGRYIQGLICIQAAICALAVPYAPGLALWILLLWPANVFLSRYFYAS